MNSSTMFNHVLIYMGSIDTTLLIYPGCSNNGKFSDVLTEYGGQFFVGPLLHAKKLGGGMVMGELVAVVAYRILV